MGVADIIGKGAVAVGKKLISKTPAELAEEAGIQFSKKYKPGMKLPKKLLKYMNLKNKPGWVKKILATMGIGGASITGDRYLSSRWERAKTKTDERAKGGYVRKMKAGGSVRRMNKGGSVSRGTGAAIKGTKFKGVF